MAVLILDGSAVSNHDSSPTLTYHIYYLSHEIYINFQQDPGGEHRN